MSPAAVCSGWPWTSISRSQHFVRFTFLLFTEKLPVIMFMLLWFLGASSTAQAKKNSLIPLNRHSMLSYDSKVSRFDIHPLLREWLETNLMIKELPGKWLNFWKKEISPINTKCCKWYWLQNGTINMDFISLINNVLSNWNFNSQFQVYRTWCSDRSVWHLVSYILCVETVEIRNKSHTYL